MLGRDSQVSTMGSIVQGGCVFGGLRLGCGPLALPEKLSHEVLEAYLGHGGRWIDVAPKYGFECSAEAWLGRSSLFNRYNMKVITKVGAATFDNPGPGLLLSADAIQKSVDQSRKRLNRDVLDVVLCHVETPDLEATEVVDTMAALVDSGVIRYWGVSNFTAETVHTLSQLSEEYRSPSVFQYRYSVTSRAVEHTMDNCPQLAHGTKIAWAPLNGGQLAGTAETSTSTYSLRGFTQTPEELRLLLRLGEAARQQGVTPVQLALEWLRHRGWTPVVTFSRPSHCAEAMRSVVVSLDDDVIDNAPASSNDNYPRNFFGQHSQFFTTPT